MYIIQYIYTFTYSAITS